MAFPSVSQDSLNTFRVGTKWSSILDFASEVRLVGIVSLVLTEYQLMIMTSTYTVSAAEGVSQFRNTHRERFKVYIKLYQERLC